MEREDIKMLVKKWKDIYEDKSLDYKNLAMDDSAKLKPLIDALDGDDAISKPKKAPSAA